MDSRYRKFLALAEVGSFSGAARQVRVTQPAITLAVASLEHALGVRLYVRRTSPIELTPEGEVVANTARAMMAEMDKMHGLLQQGPANKPYHIGLIDSVAHLLFDAESEHPLLDGVNVMVDNSRRILQDLLSDGIDFGVITGQPTALEPGIIVRKLHNEEFVFVTAPHRAPGGFTNQIHDWLATDTASTTYHHFLESFRRKHLSVTPIFHSASMELLRDMAISGKGTALLPRHIARGPLSEGLLTVVRTKPLYRPIWTVSRRSAGKSIATSLEARLNALLAKG